MASIFRRAGAQILAMLSSTASPGSDTTAVQWFAKTIAGVTQQFIKTSDLEYQITPSLSVAARMAYYLEDFYSSVSVGGSPVLTTAIQGAPGNNRQSVTTGNSVVFSGTGAALNWIVGGGELVHECRTRTPTVQDGTNQWSDRFGMSDQTSVSEPSNGVYFEADRATFGDNNVRIVTANTGSRTKTSTGSVQTAATFERWRFVVDSAGTSVQAFLNDTTAGSAVAATIPTVGLGAFFGQVVKTLGSTARQSDRDYFETYQVLSR